MGVSVAENKLISKPATTNDHRSQNDDSSIVLANELRSRPARGYQYYKTQYRIPDQITCTLCDITKAARAFSDNQKAKMVQSRGDHGIICIACNDKSLKEWTCCLCHRTMGQRKFAKSQRKKGEDAECFDCVAERINSDDEGDEGRKSLEGNSQRMIEGASDGKGKELVPVEQEETRGRSMQTGAQKQNRWVAQAMDGVANLDIGGQEWSDNESDVSVESDDSDCSHFSV